MSDIEMTSSDDSKFVELFQVLMPPDEDRWAERVENACRVLEYFHPYGALNKPETTVRGKSFDRMKYLRSRTTTSSRRFIISNGRDAAETPTKFVDDRYANVNGAFFELSRTIYRLGVQVRSVSIAERIKIFEHVADAVDAYSGDLIPMKSSSLLFSYGCSRRVPESPEMQEHFERAKKLIGLAESIGRELPDLDYSYDAMFVSPLQPQSLGWINYWSLATCDYLGFPDPVRDRDLLEHSYRTECGAWIVKLCAEPLDLERPEHLRTFLDIFERFPKLGLRRASTKPTFGFPQHTAFVQSSEREKVVQAVSQLCHAAGYRERIEGLQEKKDFVQIAVFPGTEGWTVVQSNPGDFLWGEGEGNRPRFVELCELLECRGGLVNTYSDVEMSFLECDGQGRIHLSGYRELTDGEEEPTEFEIALGENPTPVEVTLLPVEIEILDADNCAGIAAMLYDALGGHNSFACNTNDKGFKAHLSKIGGFAIQASFERDS